MKKERIIKYGTMGSYLLLYIIVAIVSLVSSVHFFNLAHQGWMSIVLACSFEIGQMACLFGALTRRKKGFDIVWIMFVVLTMFQCMANTYAAYIGLADYVSWSELFGLNEMEPMEQKRIIAGISGAILPLIALGFIKCLTDYMNETDTETQKVMKAEEPVAVEDDTPEPVESETTEEEPAKDTEKPAEEKKHSKGDLEKMTEELLRNKIKKEREPQEFAGFVMSDDDVKKIEDYGRSGVASSKKDMEETLNELKEYTKE